MKVTKQIQLAPSTIEISADEAQLLYDICSLNMTIPELFRESGRSERVKKFLQELREGLQS